MTDSTADLPPYSHELDWPDGLEPYQVINLHGTQGEPFAHYAWMRRNAPVLRCATADGDVWVFSRHADVRWGLRKPKLFSSVVNQQDEFKAILTVLDDPDHARLRQVIAGAFTPKAVSALEDRVRQTASHYFSELLAAGGGEVIESFTKPLAWTTVCNVLDIPLDDLDRVGALADGMLTFFIRVSRGAPGNPPHDEESFRELMDYMRSHLIRLHEAGNDALVGAVARAWLDERIITEQEASELCCLIFQAGFETTARLMAETFRYLADDPALLVRLRKEPEVAQRFVEELVRLRGPLHRAFRRATQDVELGGVTVPKDALVHFVIASASRDELVWSDPDSLDVDREEQGHFGFGYGVHGCLGAPLARLEAQAAAELIAAHVAEVRYDPDRDLAWLQGNTISYGPDWLRVELLPLSGESQGSPAQ